MSLLTFFFIPSFLMLGVMTLSLIKAFHNALLNFLLVVGFLGFPISLIFITHDALGNHEYLGGFLYGFIMVVLNCYPYILMNRLLNKRRCPHCHGYTGKLLNKTVEEYERIRNRTYRDNDSGKRYYRKTSSTKTYSTYEMLCPECLMEWNFEEESSDHQDSGIQEIR